jgi:hypothetical protein
MAFGTGSAEICKFSALILHSLHIIHKKSYQGKGVLSGDGKVCIEMRLGYQAASFIIHTYLHVSY